MRTTLDTLRIFPRDVRATDLCIVERREQPLGVDLINQALHLLAQAQLLDRANAFADKHRPTLGQYLRRDPLTPGPAGTAGSATQPFGWAPPPYGQTNETGRPTVTWGDAFASDSPINGGDLVVWFAERLSPMSTRR